VSGIFVHGIGAVSPAGWGSPPLCDAIARGTPLPVEMLPRPGWNKKLAVRTVPLLAARPEFLSHPRLRRAGAMSQHTVAAALEALGPDAARVQAGTLRLGIIVCTMAGGVSYSRRFYEEVMQEPSTASPLIFPETVFNAPASHLAAYLHSSGINYTLVGDEGSFLLGLALAADWLEAGQAEACVVVGAEELDWVVADAARLFQRSVVSAGGAGALYLKRDSTAATVLAAITDSFPYTKSQKQRAAAEKVRRQLGPVSADEWLCDSQTERSLWRDWPGPRLTPKAIVGEAFAASAAWHCVIACAAIAEQCAPSACVSIVGANQQAIGARFARAGSSRE